MVERRNLPAEATQDKPLVAGLSGGDESVFAELIESYGEAMLRIARGVVASPAVAEEVVQDTWLAVFTGVHRFEGRSSLRTWIFRILMNTAHTQRTRDARTLPFADLGREFSDDEPAVDTERFLPTGHQRWPGHWSTPPQSWESDPESRVLAAETLDVVRDVLDLLPTGQRAVVTLRDVQGWTPAEVSEALGVTRGPPHQLHGVAMAEPYREVPRPLRLGQEGTDAQAHDLQAMPVVVEPAQVLAEDLAHAVVGVRSNRHVDTDRLAHRVEADGMVAGREDDTPAAFQPGRLEDVEGSPDVDIQDLFELRLLRDGGEVNDRLATGQRAAGVLQAPYIALDDLFARPGLERDDVRQPQHAGLAGQTGTHHRADRARGPRHQQALHRPNASSVPGGHAAGDSERRFVPCPCRIAHADWPPPAWTRAATSRGRPYALRSLSFPRSASPSWTTAAWRRSGCI